MLKIVDLFGEPQLGRRGLYPTISKKGQYDTTAILTNFIAYCDGTNDLIDISNLINVDTETLIEVVEELNRFELLDRV